MGHACLELARDTLSDYWSSSETKQMQGRLSASLSPILEFPNFAFCFRLSVSLSLSQSLSLLLGGFTAWWIHNILSSKYSEPFKRIGHKLTKSCPENINTTLSSAENMSEFTSITLASERINVQNCTEPSNRAAQMSSSQRCIEHSCFLADSWKNKPNSHCSVSENALTSNSEFSSPREEHQCSLDASVEKLQRFDFCLPEHRSQLLDAVMLGDEAFVASALEHVDNASLEEHGTDEYGNSLLILAVQVGSPRGFRPRPVVFARRCARRLTPPPPPPRPAGRASAHRGAAAAPRRRRGPPKLPRAHGPPLRLRLLAPAPRRRPPRRRGPHRHPELLWSAAGGRARRRVRGPVPH